jgi:hypothetical protein
MSLIKIKKLRNYSGYVKLDRHLPCESVALLTWRHAAPREVPVKLAAVAE